MPDDDAIDRRQQMQRHYFMTQGCSKPSDDNPN